MSTMSFMQCEASSIRMRGSEMAPTGKARPLLETGMRIAADTVIVSVSFAIAMLARYILEIWGEGSGLSREVVLQYVEGYLQNFWILTTISVAVFAMSGFYTRGRYYQGRYKVLVIAQA